jgi:hypothetical protein
MKAVICKSKADAQKLSDDVDRVNNLPWSGVNHDTWRVVPNQTLHMADIIEHPNNGKCAYPDCAEVQEQDDGHGGKKPAKVAVPQGATTQDLGEDWTPPPVVEMHLSLGKDRR